MLLAALKRLDSVILAGTFLAAMLLTRFAPHAMTLQDFLSMRLKVVNFALFLGIVATWRLIFEAFQLYDPSRAYFSGERLRDTVIATTLSVLVAGGLGYAANVSVVTGPFLLAFGLLANSAVLGTRLLLRSALTSRLGAKSVRRILVVGTGPRALRFAEGIDSNPGGMAAVIGFCDEPWAGIDEFHQQGHHLVTDPKNFRSFVRSNVVDEVVIALPLSALERYRTDILETCEEHGITVRFLSNILSDLGVRSARGEGFGEGVLVSVYNGVVYGRQFLVKRTLDVALSLVLLVLAAPVFAAAALAIRLSSPGPIFFTQVRIGFNKRPFRMIKFRTMSPDAEQQMEDLEHLNEAEGPVFKIKDDPRITRVGRILRNTSIDELPQLVNVLKGEMSLIGPRPLPVRDFARFDQDRHRRRFSVIPGLTGLWQVSGRSSIGFEEWMELDLKYVDEWSLGLDLEILVRTIPAVLKRVGAQ